MKNNFHTKNILLTLGLSICASMLLSSCNTQNSTAMSTKDAVLQNIHNRKSVRRYIDKTVSKEDLLTLLKAGMAAPSAKNVQPWLFVVLSDKAIMKQLAEQLPYAKMLTTSSAAIVVCGDMSKVQEPEKSLWYQDCSAAAQNILLAAEAMGLGAVWTAAYPYPDRMEMVRTALNMPMSCIPLCVIPVGYADGSEKPKDKWKEENVRWGKW
ncbi:MAG: nitroreductase family protein [Bacteroidales bacterium]